MSRSKLIQLLVARQPRLWSFSLLFLLSVMTLTECETAKAQEKPKIVPLTPVGPELQFGRLFNDHMVLQRDRKVTIWGWADPSEEVQVSFAGQVKSTTTAADRRWSVELDPLAASAEGRDLVVTGKTGSVTLTDVLVGEVWLLGGQSNMSMPFWVRSDGFTKEDIAAHPEYASIRCCTTLKTGFADPPYDKLDWIQRERQVELPFKREWVVFDSKCLDLHGPSFSAFGFFFAKNLQEELQVPIGLIDTSVGGTLAHYWAPSEPQRTIAGLEESYQSEFWFPGCLYHTTIWPIRDLSFRGAVFYLGENNSMTKPLGIFEPTYREVIKSWRETFGQAELPFCIVQTANCGSTPTLYGPGPHNAIQEALLRIHRSTPRTGFVVTTDEVHGDLHLMRKQSIGQRAARWAMAEVYPESAAKIARTWGTPVIKSVQAQGNRLLVELETSQGEGLVIKANPVGFVIAGADQKFHEAKAELVNATTLALWSDEVAQPVAARFAWSSVPYLNLWTESGLPVSPFRTDDWPLDW